MALLFMDGFSGGDASVKWNSVNGSPSRTTTTPRFSGGVYLHQTSSYNLTKRYTASAEVYVGCAFSTTGADLTVSFLGDSNTTTHITFIYSGTSKVFKVYRGTTSGTLLATGTTILGLNAWHYAEMHVKISDTVGVAELRLDGATTNEITFSGDTKNAGTNISVDSVLFIASTTLDFTDVYICDTTGSTNNSWLGDVTVRTLTPNGNGAFSQLLGSDADSVNNYLLVNEQPVSSTQYTGSATTSQHDSYTMADLPAGTTTVRGVQLNSYMAKSDATAGSSKGMLRIASTNYYGATQTLTTTYATYTDPFDLNPNTTIAWTPTDVNGLETGMEVA